MEVSFIPRNYVGNKPTAYLGVIDFSEISIEPKRIYWLSDFVEGATRGHHAHKKLSQLFVVLSGKITITLSTASSSNTFELDASSDYLLIKPGLWRVLSNASEGTVLLVIADQNYDEQDYIRDWDEYLEWYSERI